MLVWLPPVLCLHLLLLPVNVRRLHEILMMEEGGSVPCWRAATRIFGARLQTWQPSKPLHQQSIVTLR
jgi:hypothetical protein